MIFSSVWDRYFKHFGGFALTGLGVFLLGLGAWVVMTIVAMVMMMPVIFRMSQSFVEMGSMGPGGPMDPFGPLGPMGNPTLVFQALMPMVSAMLPMIVVMLILSVFLYGFMGAGVMGAVVAHRRGLPVEFGTFWSYGARYFWRMSGLAALYTLLAAALSLVLYVPLARTWLEAFFTGRLGTMALMIPLLFLLWLLLLFVMNIIIVNTLIYPAYLIASDDQGVLEAYAAGWRTMAGNFGEAVVGGSIMLLFSVVIGLASVISVIPLLGFLAYMAFLVFALPFIALYFSERFEQRIRPTF